MKTIVSELAVEYKDEGEGPVVLMLHGWGNTLHYFDELSKELERLRLVRLDLPGFGGSDTPSEPWTVQRYARFVVAFCEKMKLVPEMMLGHSFGGRVLIKAVGSGMLQSERLVLIASAGVADRKTARNALYAAIAKVGKVMLAPFPPAWHARARRALYARTGSDYLEAGKLSETFLNMIHEDLSEDAARIRVPTLLVWGKDDLVTPLSEGERLHELIRDSELRVVSGAGHFVHRDHPAEVARLIRDFL